MAPGLSSISKDTVEATLRELERPAWRERHEGYLKRMGTRPIAMAPYGYPAWETVLRRFNAQGHGLLQSLVDDDGLRSGRRPEAARLQSLPVHLLLASLLLGFVASGVERSGFFEDVAERHGRRGRCVRATRGCSVLQGRNRTWARSPVGIAMPDKETIGSSPSSKAGRSPGVRQRSCSNGEGDSGSAPDGQQTLAGRTRGENGKVQHRNTMLGRDKERDARASGETVAFGPADTRVDGTIALAVGDMNAAWRLAQQCGGLAKVSVHSLSMVSDLVSIKGLVRPAAPAHPAATSGCFSHAGRTKRRFRKTSNANTRHPDTPLARRGAAYSGKSPCRPLFRSWEHGRRSELQNQVACPPSWRSRQNLRPQLPRGRDHRTPSKRLRPQGRRPTHRAEIHPQDADLQSPPRGDPSRRVRTDPHLKPFRPPDAVDLELFRSDPPEGGTEERLRARVKETPPRLFQVRDHGFLYQRCQEGQTRSGRSITSPATTCWMVSPPSVVCVVSWNSSNRIGAIYRTYRYFLGPKRSDETAYFGSRRRN